MPAENTLPESPSQIGFPNRSAPPILSPSFAHEGARKGEGKVTVCRPCSARMDFKLYYGWVGLNVGCDGE